jgi:hypothetical protein
MPVNRQGPNSFCFGAPCLAHRQSNPASGYSGLRFFTARLTSNPSQCHVFAHFCDKEVNVSLTLRPVNRSRSLVQANPLFPANQAQNWLSPASAKTAIRTRQPGLYRSSTGLQSPTSLIRFRHFLVLQNLRDSGLDWPRHLRIASCLP